MSSWIFGSSDTPAFAFLANLLAGERHIRKKQMHLLDKEARYYINSQNRSSHSLWRDKSKRRYRLGCILEKFSVWCSPSWLRNRRTPWFFVNRIQLFSSYRCCCSSEPVRNWSLWSVVNSRTHNLIIGDEFHIRAKEKLNYSCSHGESNQINRTSDQICPWVHQWNEHSYVVSVDQLQNNNWVDQMLCTTTWLPPISFSCPG